MKIYVIMKGSLDSGENKCVKAFSKREYAESSLERLKWEEECTQEHWIATINLKNVKRIWPEAPKLKRMLEEY